MTSQSSAKELEITFKPIGDEQYVRSGLLGFLGPGGLVFVCGSRDGLMTVTGRKHNADDIIATVLAVEPLRFETLNSNLNYANIKNYFKIHLPWPYSRFFYKSSP